MVSACGLKLMMVSAPTPGANTKLSLPGPPTVTDTVWLPFVRGDVGVGIGHGLAGREIYLIVAEHEIRD